MRTGVSHSTDVYITPLGRSTPNCSFSIGSTGSVAEKFISVPGCGRLLGGCRELTLLSHDERLLRGTSRADEFCFQCSSSRRARWTGTCRRLCRRRWHFLWSFWWYLCNRAWFNDLFVSVKEDILERFSLLRGFKQLKASDVRQHCLRQAGLQSRSRATLRLVSRFIRFSIPSYLSTLSPTSFPFSSPSDSITYTLWVFTVPQLTPFLPSAPGELAAVGAFSTLPPCAAPSRKQKCTTAVVGHGHGG